MNYDVFLREMANKVEEAFCKNIGECSVSINQVIKNNGVKLDGLVILRENCNISPNIYIVP